MINEKLQNKINQMQNDAKDLKIIRAELHSNILSKLESMEDGEQKNNLKKAFQSMKEAEAGKDVGGLNNIINLLTK